MPGTIAARKSWCGRGLSHRMKAVLGGARVGSALELHFDALCDFLPGLGLPRDPILIQFPHLLHHGGSQLRSNLLEVPTKQGVLARHVQPRLVELLQVVLPLCAESGVRELAHRQGFKLILHPLLALHLGLANRPPQLHQDLIIHLLCLQREASQFPRPLHHRIVDLQTGPARSQSLPEHGEHIIGPHTFLANRVAIQDGLILPDMAVQISILVLDDWQVLLKLKPCN